MHEDLVRNLAAAELQHRGPKEGVEIGDVFADEVNLLCGRMGQEGVDVLPDFFEMG